MTDVELRHGAVMPRIGLGTWRIDAAETERVVADAILAGYRLIDTAEKYGNEASVGAGVRASGIARDEVFITTKFGRAWHSVDGVAEAFLRSAERLALDYIDLLLIHWPNPDQDRYVEAWQGLVALLGTGSVRAIGVSNFTAAHLRRIIAETSVVPDLNQLQINPRYTQRDNREFDDEHGIVTQSWGPIGRGTDLLCQAPVLEAAERAGCTPAQAVLAWHLSHGLSVVPKSTDPTRLRENLAAASVVLAPQDIVALDAMDGQEAPKTHPDTFGL